MSACVEGAAWENICGCGYVPAVWGSAVKEDDPNRVLSLVCDVVRCSIEKAALVGDIPLFVELEKEACC